MQPRKEPVTKLAMCWERLPDKYQSLIRFIRYCIVGVCAATVHYGIYYCLLRINVPVNPAYIAGYLLSFIGNYFATSYFTFRSVPSWGHFVGFAGSHAVNFVLHIVLLNFFLWLGISKLIAPFLVMTVAMLVQYFILHWVYRGRKNCKGTVAMLSFDTEEFDVPREHGVAYTLKEGMAVSRYGTECILDCLKACGIHATFFCTTNFAHGAPDLIRRIMNEGHEIAAHGCDHWQPKAEDVILSKQELERLTGRTVLGYRQPRMFPVDLKEQARQGYVYNASLNPAFIPGRYMHLTTPRRWFMQEGVLQIPASVTPWFRIPMFWLALHNFPLWLYKAFTKRILRHDGYFNTYFHPWEFYPLGEHPEWKLPFIIRNHAGRPMCERLQEVIMCLKDNGVEFCTYGEFAANVLNK